MSELKNKALNGLIWTFSQQFGFQLINFVVSIILARLLLPAEFGLIGIIAIFINIGKTLVDSGMTSSLIRTDNPDQSDYSTVFFTNLVISLFVYIVTFLLAPILASFLQQPILTDLIRVYCLVFIVAAFSTVQSTKLNKEMRFKTQLMINLPSLIVGSIIGVVLAYKGYGVWSLIWLNLAQVIVATAQLWIFSGWRPTLSFNRDKLKKHFSFGYKLTLSGLLNTTINNVYRLIIAKYFSISQLGYYTRAKSMQELPVTNISNTLNKVTYPLFASINKDELKLRSSYLKLIQQVAFIVIPILLTAIVIAEPLFRFLLTEKWLPAVPYFQLMCIAGIFLSLNSYNLNILLVKGKSNSYLKLETVKNIMTLASLTLVIPFGIYGLLWGQIISAFIIFFLNSLYVGKQLNLSVILQLKPLLSILINSLIASSVGYFAYVHLTQNVSSDLINVITVTFITFFIYLLLAFILKSEPLKEIFNIISKKQFI